MSHSPESALKQSSHWVNSVPNGLDARAKKPRSVRPRERSATSPPEPPLDAFALYELAATNPGPLAAFVRAVYGPSGNSKKDLGSRAKRTSIAGPRTLREDFSGTGALAREWTASDPNARAILVDSDPAPLEWARALLTPDQIRRTQLIQADVMTCQARCDALVASNFPIGYFHERAALLSYLRASRERLRRGGILVCDLYGGPDAWTPGVMKQSLKLGKRRVVYSWHQQSCDPLSGRVHCAMHFEVGPEPNAGRNSSKRRARTLRNAFTYDWRLWSIPEAQDAMLEAGFRAVDIYDELGGAIDQDGNLHVRPVRAGEPLGSAFVVYLVGRK
ncbi:MAG: class I SAM-dependent methyltransferase [Planctomycetota bacterium]|nr:class I SAM-dependent methyltransferase [Planctomycetota bacterium]